MKRTDMLLPLLGAMALVLTIALTVDRTTSPRRPEPGVSQQALDSVEASSLLGTNDARKLGSSQSDAIRTLVESSGDQLQDFTVVANDTSGAPLRDADFQLLHANSPAVFRGKTNISGEYVFRIPPGRYHVTARHARHGLLSANFLPARTVVVPGVAATSVWAEAHIYGVRIVGTDCAAELSSHRFDPNDPPLYRLAKEFYEEMESRARSTWGDACFIVFPKEDHSLVRRLTVFDRERGPCRFDIPIAKLSDFSGPTECDIGRAPYVEAMAAIEVRTVDARGRVVDGGSCDIVRSEMYAGVYQIDHIPTNREVPVPPGDYRVDGVCRSFSRLASKTATLVSRCKSIVEFRFPYEMHEVLVTADAKALLQVALDAPPNTSRTGSDVKPYSAPILLQAGVASRIFLPLGTCTVALIPLGPDIEKAMSLSRSFTVSNQDEPQSVALSLTAAPSANQTPNPR